MIKSIFYRHKLEEIFTPNAIAKLTYVKRAILEVDLEKYISIPGKQIIIYGHSGGGKTTLIRNKLTELKQNFIKTHCERTTTFNDILLQAFDELNRFYVAERTTNSQYTISNDLKAEYGVISSQLNSSSTESEGTKSLRIVPPQLTPQKLTKFLGEIDCIWIIEDFHKVIHQEKTRIADVLKIFIDSANDFPNIKIICIGAVGTARELIELDNNLNTRIAELLVPLLNDNEILGIVEKGCTLLNIHFDDNLKQKIVYYSNKLASLTHQICYDLCYHSEIKKTKIFSCKIGTDSFKIAVDSFVRKNSDTYVKLYDSIVCERFGREVLIKFDRSEKEYLSFGELFAGLFRHDEDAKDELVKLLEKLGSSEYDELIRYDRNSQKYSISTPFFRAFLKMKFALERSEMQERNTKRKDKRNKKFILEPKIVENELIINELYLNDYYKFLDSFSIKILENEKKKVKKKQ